MTGLIPADRVIAPYSVSFSSRGYAAEAGQPASTDLPCPPSAIRRQLDSYGLSGPVILLAGRDYFRVLEQAGRVQPYNPFTGLSPDDRRGYQMQQMNRHMGVLPTSPNTSKEGER